VRFVRGAVADTLPAIQAAAGDHDIWLVGGGELVGQFDDAGALDQLDLAIAPVTLAGGAPLLTRRIESGRLRLIAVSKQGQFVNASNAVSPP
jgi:dihydrofolate reductase